jgi:hypothetical protein
LDDEEVLVGIFFLVGMFDAIEQLAIFDSRDNLLKADAPF